MNDNDRDLILDLTEGTLSADDAAQVRARVASDPDLAAAYETQMATKAHLESLPPVAMASEERAVLRGNLIEQLRLDSPPESVHSPSRRGFAWWKPIAGIAGVAAVVAAIVVLPGSLGGTDDAASDVALTSETRVADDAAAGGSPEEVETAPVADGSEESPAVAEVPEFTSLDGSDLLEATEGAQSPAEIADSVSALEPTSRALIDVSAVESCLERLADELPRGDVAPVAFEQRDGDALLFLTVTEADDVASVVTVNLTTCALVDVDQ
jgi:hypothetical protein